MKNKTLSIITASILKNHGLKSLLLVLALWCSAGASGQAPVWGWGLGYNGSGGEQGNAMARDAFGNIYVTGSFGGTMVLGTTTLNNTSGLEQAYLAKFDANGTPLWAVETTGIDVAQGWGVAVDANNDVYFTGHFADVITLGSTTLNSGGLFVAKYSSAGVQQWAVAPGGFIGSGNMSKAAAIDPQGNLIVTGKVYNALTFGTTTVGPLVMFVAKYNSSNGNVMWVSQATTSNIAEPWGLVLDNTGAAYITGHYAPNINFGTTSYTGAVGTDAFVAKYDNSGAYVWSDVAGGANNDAAYGIDLDASSNVYVTGKLGVTSTNVSFGSTTISANGFIKTFVVKYTSAGTVVWAQEVGGTVSDVTARSIAAESTGETYIGGYFANGPSLTIGSNTMNNVSSSNLYSDLFVAKLDNAGNAVWGKSGGGIHLDEIYAMKTDGNGSTYVTGNFNSAPMMLDAITVPNTNSSYDMFLARLDPGCTTAPGTPGTITGPTPVCAGTTQTYSVSPVAGATSYLWTLPTGWTATGASNSISVTVGTTGGTISVAAANGCGTSSTTTMTVTVNPLPVPTIMIAGNLLGVSGTFTTYQWYLNGNAINGATGATHTVTQNGNYHMVVTDANGCSGTSNIITANLTTNVKNEGKKGLGVFPTVNDGRFTVSVPGHETVSMRVYNMQGAVVHEQAVSATITVDMGDKANGIYYVELRCDGEVHREKVVVR